jgi:hypothetical protein
MKLCSLSLSLCVLIPAFAQAQAPTYKGCQVFPANNVWNTKINGLPLDSRSSTYVNTIGISHALHAALGPNVGYPVNPVTGSQAKTSVTFQYAAESDKGPYPIPTNVDIQNESDGHALIVDTTNCVLYELFTLKSVGGKWQAGSGAIFPLNSNALRPAGWTSADAAGLPMFPGTIRYEEILAGHINHAIRLTAPQTRAAYIWPARHFASSLTGAQYPPMGQRFRLKADFDISSFSPHNQVILTAMKEYGLILADNGLAWDFSGGIKDPRWDSNELKEFSRVIGADMEAVNESSLMVDPNSAQAGDPPTTSGPQPVTVSGVPTGWTNLISKASSKCLSIKGGPAATYPGAPAVQDTCVGGTNQQFLFTAVATGYKISIRNSTNKLLVSGGPTNLADGAVVWQAYFNNWANEVWKLVPGPNSTYSLKINNSGKCMTVSGTATQEDAPIKQYACTNAATQLWSFSPAS